MIVRIMGEGQLDVSDVELRQLQELDGELETAIDAGDEAKFRGALSALLDKVRDVGASVPADHLEASGLILPPADASMDEVRAMLGDEGLIPD
jgi:hypothetical protein